MLSSSVPADGPIWSHRRRRAVDRRCLAYKTWAKRRARLAARLGREPTADEGELLDLLTDLVVEADLRRAGRRPGDPGELAGEIRRQMTSLGLTGKGAAEDRGPSLADLLAEHSRGGST